VTDIEQRRKREIEHGEFLASRGAEDVWNWGSPAGRRRARRRAGFFLEHLGPGTRALEIGCGTGHFTRLCAPSGAEITATDISETLLREARERTDAPNVTYAPADAHALEFEDGGFDVVYGSSVLHHLDVDRTLGELRRVLRPGGRLILVEPNMLNPQIWAERNIGWVRRKVGASPDETAFVRFGLERRLARAGFERVEAVPHEFLHPATPESLIDRVAGLGRFLERLPLVREIAGSLVIRAVRG
jgi:SAM-dependent methyltransferase